MKANKFIRVFFVLLCLAGTFEAQAILQKGVTYRYNGKNPRTPIGGVYIKAAIAANNDVSNDTTGVFVLALDKLRMGDKIGTVRVVKSGMMVFNKDAVDEWAVRKEPLSLILCDADEFQRQKDNLIAIGRSQAKKKYDSQIAELEREKQAQQILIDDYAEKLDSLYQNYQNALKHMDEYADVFARIDASEVDTVSQRAIELFNNGKIDEAILLLEQNDLMSKLDDALRTKSNAQELRTAADKAEALADKDIENITRNIHVQISAYKMSCQWDKAGELLKSLADKLNTPEAIWDYGEFCGNQKDYNTAETYIKKAIQTLDKEPNKESTEYLDCLAKYNNGLGALYTWTQRLSEAEDALILALRIRGQLVETNPTFEKKYATVQMNLANLYCLSNRFTEAEEMYKSSLEIYSKYVKENPNEFEPEIAMAQMNYALFCQDESQRFEESESLFKSSLEITERLSKSNPQKYEPDLAITLYNLGNLYYMTYRYNESEMCHKAALEIRERLSKSNPDAHLIDLSTSLTHLANVYAEQNRFDESEKLYLKSLGICQQLANKNPNAFETSLAITLNQIACFYYSTNQYAKSVEMFKATLEIRERQAIRNPSAYERDLASALMNLASVYSDINRHSESEELYQKALLIYKRLAAKHPNVYTAKIALLQCNLAILYSQTSQYSKSEEMYKATLEIYQELNKTNKGSYLPELAMTKMNLAILYKNTERYSESADLYESALIIYRKLAESNPSAFNSNVAKCLLNAGFLYSTMGKTQEAEEKFQEAISIYSGMEESTRAAYKADIARAQYGLADLLYSEKRYIESEKAYQEALSIFKEVAVSNPIMYSLVALCQISIAPIYRKAKQYSEGIEIYKAAIETYKYLYQAAPNSFDLYYASTQMELATLYLEAKRNNESEDVYNGAIKLYQDFINANPDNSATYLEQMSYYSNLVGKFAEGEKYALESLKIDSTTTGTYKDLAAALLLQGKFDEAAKIYRDYKATLKNSFISDLDEMEQIGVIPEERKQDALKIREILGE
ncbi:MAG: tetratricopeptide repeat protein [Muribaculaceae bacterium]